MITLYGMSSPNVLKVILLLEELNLSYSFIHVNLFSGDQRADSFLALNPNGKVPILVDDATGVTSFESGAILLYLAETYGDFLPASGAARHDVIKWLMLQMATVGPMLGQLNHFVNYAPEGNDYAFNRYHREAGRVYALLDGRLSQSPWLAGENYSIADIATYPWIDYIETHGYSFEDYPALRSWCDRVSARDAVVRARTKMADIRQEDTVKFGAASEEEIMRFVGRDLKAPA